MKTKGKDPKFKYIRETGRCGNRLPDYCLRYISFAMSKDAGSIPEMKLFVGSSKRGTNRQKPKMRQKKIA